MHKMKMIAAACAAALASGCVVAPFEPPAGVISCVRAPLSTEGNWPVGSRTGEAVSQSILGVYAFGDCSIARAAQNGGLSEVYHVDYEYTNIIGIWQQVKVIVYGK